MKLVKSIRKHTARWIAGVLLITVVLILAVTFLSSEEGAPEKIADVLTIFENTDEAKGDNAEANGEAGKSDESGDLSEESKNGEETRNELITSEQAQNLVQTENEMYDSGELSGTNFSIFSGQFVEDGKDELVENVAALLVTNNSDQFLDFATLQYDIDGQTATFIVTGLPAGRSAWVMEKSELVIVGGATFTYQGCSTSMRDGVAASTDKISISSDGNMLTAVNNTNETLEGVFVYYKSLHTDGNFFGGITYLADFGTIEPGASSETLAGHYVEGSTEIVRIGWQE